MKPKPDDPTGARTILRNAALVIVYGLFPFVAFVNHNRADGVGLGAVAPYALPILVLVLSILGVVALRRGPRAMTRTAVISAGFFLGVFNFHTLEKALGSLRLEIGLGWQLMLWLLLTSALVSAFWLWSRRSGAADYLVIVGVLLVLVPAVDYFRYADAAPVAIDLPADGLAIEGDGRSRPGRSGSPPDIYFFVPDAYGRSDRLREILGFDNSAFLKQLRTRNFHIGEEALSNYTLTHVSLASMLSMDYPLDERRELGPREPYLRIIGEAPAAKVLQAMGYTYFVAPPPGWMEYECAGAEDLCIPPVAESRSLNLSELEWGLAELTPLGVLMRRFMGGALRQPSADPINTVDAVLNSEIPGPRFVFSHIMQPHPPYQHHADCRPRENIDPSLLRWGRPPGEDPVPAERQRPYYLDSVECLNLKLIQAVDRILARDDGSIIVIQADHGTPFTIDWDLPFERWSPQQAEERLAVMQAIHLPEACRGMPPDSVSPVNLIRIVIGCVQGSQPEVLPARHYLVSFRQEGVARVDPEEIP